MAPKKKSAQVNECQRRKKKIAVAYLGGKCSICGYDRCLAALDFHHVDPETKEFSPTKIIGRWSFERVKAELDKCILVCKNCHMEIHHGMHRPEDVVNCLRPTLAKICDTCGRVYETNREDQKFCSCRCAGQSYRKVLRPSREELQKILWVYPTTKIAEKFGVSDKAIEKWAKEYELTKHPRGYWTKWNRGRQGNAPDS